MSRRMESGDLKDGDSARMPGPSAAGKARLKAKRAEPVSLLARWTVARGFQAITASCITHFRLNQSLILEAKDAEALHQARVALRRLRSAFALFRPAIADQKSRLIEEELRWLLAEFGDARNLDVYLKRDLSSGQRQFAGERRSDAYERVGRAITSSRSRRLFFEMLAWLSNGDWHRNLEAGKRLDHFLGKRIDKFWKKVSKAGPVGRMDDERRHRLRAGIKKLRYALEFAAPLNIAANRRGKKFTRGVKDAQQSLGNVHDIVTAASIMALNGLLRTKQPSPRRERRMVRDADGAIGKLRQIGPYWRGALS